MRDDDFYRELSEADSEDLEKYLKDLAKLKKIREEEKLKEENKKPAVQNDASKNEKNINFFLDIVFFIWYIKSIKIVDEKIYKKKELLLMHFLEFKRKFNLLNKEEREFIYKLTLEDAINFLKTIY